MGPWNNLSQQSLPLFFLGSIFMDSHEMDSYRTWGALRDWNQGDMLGSCDMLHSCDVPMGWNDGNVRTLWHMVQQRWCKKVEKGVKIFKLKVRT